MQGTDLQQRFHRVVSCNQLWQDGDKLLLALSGGLDSVVLFNLLFNLGAHVEVAHINFGLRGEESVADSAWCSEKQFAKAAINKKLLSKIKVHIATFDTIKERKPGESIQMTARRLRYQYLKTLRTETGSQYILTAHHLNDQLETVLYNLTKGTGLKGLQGMPMKRDKLVRPLLQFTRADLEAYAHEHQLSWREDASNATLKYKRNRIRHLVIPELKAINPALEETFERSRSHFQAAQHALNYFCEGWLHEHVQREEADTFVDKQLLLEHPCSEMLLYHWLSPFGFNDSQIKDIVGAEQAGKHFDSGQYRLYAEQTRLMLTKEHESVQQTDIWLEDSASGSITLWDGRKLSWKSFEMNGIQAVPPNIARLDAAKIIWPLRVRSRKTGDIMQPLGMKGQHKLISDMLTDEKVAATEKDRVLVLESNAEIVWLIGFRISEAFKLSEHTKTVIEFEIA